MGVVECDVPSDSAMGRELIEHAHFRDAYRAPLSRPDIGVVDLFHAIFGHRPAWMSAILIARNRAATFAGLEAPTDSEILHVEKRDHYAVGEKIGPWPLYFLGAEELVAGRDNKHMDFRLSIMKVRESDAPSAIVSTICMVKNKFGRHYLSMIIPFHKFGVRTLIKSAVAARRL